MVRGDRACLTAAIERYTLASTMPRDTFCSHCGAAFTDTTIYPRTCATCGVQIWANTIPVAVVLLPVIDGAQTGPLVVRRAIPPIGKLALVGGFVEITSRGRSAPHARCARKRVWRSIPRGSSRCGTRRALPALTACCCSRSRQPSMPRRCRRSRRTQASERGIFFGARAATGEADDDLAFPLHREAARRHFARSSGSRVGFVAR
jgi:hypothetical protein